MYELYARYFHATVTWHESVTIADRVNRVIKALFIVSRIFFNALISRALNDLLKLL